MAGALIGKLAGSLFSKAGGKVGMGDQAGGMAAPEAPRNFGFNNMMNPQQPGGMLPTPPMGMGNSMGGGMGGMLKNRLFGG